MIPGIHVSTSGGLEKAPGRLRELGLSAGQIFTANQRRWSSTPLPEATVREFRREKGGMLFVSHASYLINLASSREDVLEKSLIALEEEFERCRDLEVPFLVLHPGAFQTNGPEKGLAMISQGLNAVMASVEDGPMLLLENTAGAGTTMGRTFEELRDLREACRFPERIGFCIDTAHAHGAGYDLNDPGFAHGLERVLGAELVKVFHLNGSKVEAGSRRDRHEHYGSGLIHLKALTELFNDRRFDDALGIAETPGTDQERASDIRMLSR